MKKQINEVERMQELAGILKENEGQTLTNEEKTELESKIEKFLNEAIFSSNFMHRDNENLSPTLEEQAIKFIIDNLSERISYYN